MMHRFQQLLDEIEDDLKENASGCANGRDESAWLRQHQRTIWDVFSQYRLDHAVDP
jgi:hypothetical protein